MSHVTKVLTTADSDVAVSDAVITRLASNKIQIDSALGGLTPLAVGDIVYITGSTGGGNNGIFRCNEELVADDSYVFQKQGDDHEECSTETSDAITLTKSQGFCPVDTIGLVLQAPTGTYSVQPKVSVDGKVFIDEGAALAGTATRRVITNHVKWLWLDVGSVTGTVEVAIGY